jgi:hypothetical protein
LNASDCVLPGIVVDQLGGEVAEKPERCGVPFAEVWT